MENSVQIEDLKKISTVANQNNIEILKNEVGRNCIRKEIERIKAASEELNASRNDLALKNAKLEEQLAEIESTMPMQEMRINMANISLQVHKDLVKKEKETNMKWLQKYEEMIEKAKSDLTGYRARFEQHSEHYRDLRKSEIDLKKSKIECRDIEVKLAIRKKIEKQYNDIQKNIFQKKIVQFAEFYTLHEKSVKEVQNLEVFKSQENELLKKHLEKQTNTKLETKNKQVKRLSGELPEIFGEFMKTSKLYSNFMPEKNFSENKHKVQILDVKVIPPQSQKEAIKQTKSKEKSAQEQIKPPEPLFQIKQFLDAEKSKVKEEILNPKKRVGSAPASQPPTKKMSHETKKASNQITEPSKPIIKSLSHTIPNSDTLSARPNLSQHFSNSQEKKRSVSFLNVIAKKSDPYVGSVNLSTDEEKKASGTTCSSYPQTSETEQDENTSMPFAFGNTVDTPFFDFATNTNDPGASFFSGFNSNFNMF